MAPACAIVVAVAIVASLAFTATSTPLSAPDAFAQGANATEKFDEGFYTKIQQLIAAERSHDAISSSSSPITPPSHDVLIVVSTDDGAGNHSDIIAESNKYAVEKRLNDMKATNIVRAESLSFVTATVPLTKMAELAQFDIVYRLGDGEQVLSPTVSTARQTINAETADLTVTGRTAAYDGTGVLVAVVDAGIDNVALNSKVSDRAYCVGTTAECRAQTATDRTYTLDGTPHVTHGTKVAGVIAATGTSSTAGIAPGVRLLDAMAMPSNTQIVSDNVGQTTLINISHALDWAFTKGADVANLSMGFNSCSSIASASLIVNEAVDKGMVIVGAAGNEGAPKSTSTTSYSSISGPMCAHNVITVGGTNDRGDTLAMLTSSSRGPTPTDNRLKPEIAAPASGIDVIGSPGSGTLRTTDSGTSYAAPQVTAAAAILLQAKPVLTPIEVKAALLLGADWQGPETTCTASMFETASQTSFCSYAKKPSSRSASGVVGSTMNNVGLGTLNVGQALDYVTTSGHVVRDHISSTTETKRYTFQVTDTTKPVKIMLSWLAHSHAPIATTATMIPTSTIPAVADLNMSITGGTPSSTISSSSANQTVEFAVFKPTSTGTYTITVSAASLGSIKPLQNFALASTNVLSEVTTSTNTEPRMSSKTVTVHPTESTSIWITARDWQRDSISFTMSDPTHGTVTTEELINANTSRILYTPKSTLATAGTDSFTVTPHDGILGGRPATITVVPESLPTSSTTSASISTASINNWSGVTLGGGVASYSTFTPSTPSAPISSMVISASDVDGATLSFSSGSSSYKVAILRDDFRQINFSPAITISSPSLAVTAVDEGEPSGTVMVGTATASSTTTACPQGGSRTAPHTLNLSTVGAVSIPDNVKSSSGAKESASKTINVSQTGTSTSISVSVNIRHTYTGDLVVELVAPDGTKALLHDHEGNDNRNLITTYTNANKPTLANMVGRPIMGHWTLQVTDTLTGDRGTLNSWSISMGHGACPVIPPRLGDTVLFSDDFEDGLGKWTETGEGDWTTSRQQTHSIPIAPNNPDKNRAAHADNCDTSCTITTKDNISLSSYRSVSLSFLRFVDRHLDSGEYLKVEVSRDGGRSWIQLGYWTENSPGVSTWVHETYDLSSYAGSPTFALRFVTSESSSKEDVEVDDVVVSASTSAPTSPPPPIAPPPPTPTPPPPPPPPSPAPAYSIYVANSDDHEIRVYNADGTYVGTFVDRRSGGLDEPWGIAFGPDGHLYVADNDDRKIRRYNGSTGAPLGTGSDASTNSELASLTSRPRGMAWHENTLYVATDKGIERFNTSGRSLGTFGDAVRTISGTMRMTLAYDVAFGTVGSSERMYVAAGGQYRLPYYTTSSGTYLGAIERSSSLNVWRPSGLAWDDRVVGSPVLYQGGDDRGYVHRINPVTQTLLRSFTGSTYIDEPYGMDVAPDGTLYVANKDTDNVAVISPTGQVKNLISSGRLDDPRDVIVGPGITRLSPALSADTLVEPLANPNAEPEFTVSMGDVPVDRLIELDSGSLPAMLTISGTDADGDAITFGLDLGSDNAPISITNNDGNTATLTVNDASEGSYVFRITATDVHETEREPYVLVITSASADSGE